MIIHWNTLFFMIESVELNKFFIQQLQFYYQLVSKVITIRSTLPLFWGSPDRLQGILSCAWRWPDWRDGPSDQILEVKFNNTVKRTTTENCGGERKREKEKRKTKERKLWPRKEETHILFDNFTIQYTYVALSSPPCLPWPVARLGFSIFLSCLLAPSAFQLLQLNEKKKRKKKAYFYI